MVNALEKKECGESMAGIIADNSLPEERLSVIVSGMYALLKEALRVPLASLKQEVRTFTKQYRECCF